MIEITMLDNPQSVALDAVVKIVEESCVTVTSQAETLCPVDTGQLKGSIAYSVKKDSGGAVGTVGTNSDHAIPAEFGSRTQVAQPYMRPAGEKLEGATDKQIIAKYGQAQMVKEFKARRMKRV